MMQFEHAIVSGERFDPARPKRDILLLTATLKPPAAAVARSDHQERLNDYLRALEFYLRDLDAPYDRILFVDNSMGGVGSIEAAARRTPHDKLVEIISFAGNDHPVTRGKAYGEFKLIDHGLALSSIVHGSDMIWKTTGRLRLLNIRQLRLALPDRPLDLVCDLHNVPLVGTDRLHRNRYMDLRVFAVRRDAYDVAYRGAWERIEGFDAFAMYDLSLQARRHLRVLPRFPREPRLQGISGRHLRDYGAWPGRMKSAVRGGLRRALPYLWL
ncbi:MAG: hypothetical protein J0H14_13850 [Alphaproteobacteria bacterium]|nr:hypothetical protein [Alphaproteobacteria bacterium]